MNMISNAIEISNIFTLHLIEEFGTFLIHSEVKTALPLLCLIDMDLSGFDALNYKIGLYQCLVLTAKHLCYRFLLFVGPVHEIYVGLHH